MGKWLLAILLTHAASPRSEVVLVDPSEPSGPSEPSEPASTVTAGFEHLPDGSPHGALLPGGRTVMVAVDRTPSFDRSFAGALLRIEPGRPALELCDRVVHSSTPLVTPEGRVFVERGRAGPDLGDRLRVDELTIEEAAATGMREVWRGHGYLAHLAGFEGRELIVYRVGPEGASLWGVNLNSGAERAIVRALPPFARDFHVEAGGLVFANRDDERRDRWAIERVELSSGRRTRLLTSSHQVLAPHPFCGDVAYNDGGLTRLAGGRVEHRPGEDVVAAVSGRLAAVLHYAGGPLPELEVTDGKEVRQIAAPADSHIQVVGFVR